MYRTAWSQKKIRKKSTYLIAHELFIFILTKKDIYGSLTKIRGDQGFKGDRWVNVTSGGCRQMDKKLLAKGNMVENGKRSAADERKKKEKKRRNDARRMGRS